MSEEAYDINKQTTYIAPKLKTESRVHYAPEPARGTDTQTTFMLANSDKAKNRRTQSKKSVLCPHVECRRGAHIPSLGREPVGE